MRARWMTAILVILPAAAAEPPPLPPDAEFLEFLGETAGEDEAFVLFMESREAERELTRAEQETPKDDDDE
jgi:hypothetical protein